MATITIPTDGPCDWIFASNTDPTLALGFQENGSQTTGTAGGIHAYTRANSASTSVLLIEGRQMPIGFRPATEGDSDVFTLQFEVALDTPGDPVGASIMDRAAFDALLALIEDPSLPYIAVCDGWGRRWFAFVEFVDGSYTWQAHEHLADIKVSEVASVPAVVTTSSPITP